MIRDLGIMNGLSKDVLVALATETIKNQDMKKPDNTWEPRVTVKLQPDRFKVNVDGDISDIRGSLLLAFKT